MSGDGDFSGRGNDADVIAKILKGFNSAMTDPSSAGVTGFAQGLLQAATPHEMTPISGGQALGMGAAASQQYQSQALKNEMLRATVPYKQLQVASFVKAYNALQDPNASPADKAAAKAFMYSMAGAPALGTAMYTNAPSVAGPRERAISQNKPTLVPASDRAFGPVGNQSVGAQGALPEGTAQPPPGTPGAPQLGALNLSFLPGAPQAVSANAFNQAGAAAAGKYPVEAALAYHTRAPGHAGATLGPKPAPFVPMGGAPAQPLPSPAALAAAQAAGTQAPVPPAPLPGAQASPGLPARTGAAPAQGAGIFSPGMSAAAYAASKAVGDQTGADVKEASTESSAARQQVAVYNQMAQALEQMGPTGAWRDVSTPLGHLANYFGLTPFNITSAAEFQKYRTQLVGAATHAVSPRASTQEMDFISKQVPDYNLPGVAPRVLVSELRGLSQFQVLKANALPVYLQTMAQKVKGPYRGTSMGFEKWWVNNGPSPSAIVIGSVLNGLPPAQAAAYVRKLRSTVTGQHMIRQYERAQAFEQQYPGIFKGL